MRTTHWSAALLIATMLLTVSDRVHATIRNVPADHRTIQAGIDASRAGDTVLVRPGIYRTNLTISNRNVVIASLLLTTGDRSYIDSTIIDGGGAGSVVLFSGDGDTSSLRGFTIRNGVAQSGGGIYSRNHSNASLEDLLVTGNQANSVGGGISALTATLRMKRVSVIGNSASSGGGLHGGFDAVITMDEGIIRANEAEIAGAIYLSRAKINLNHVAIVENRATAQYGGVYSFDAPGEDAVVFENVTLAYNENAQDVAAGGLTILAPREDCRCRITNSILWGDSNREVAIVGDAPANCLTVDYSDVEEGRDGMMPADNNIIVVGEGLMNDDPAFADRAQGDYHLSAASPCIDVGDPASDEDADGTRADLGAYPVNQRRFFIGGVVLNAVTDQPISSADIWGTMEFGFLLRDSSDNEGHWGRWFFMLSDTTLLHMNVAARGFITSRFDVEVHRNDSLSIVTRLNFSAIVLPDDDLVVGVDSGSTATVPFKMINDGNGPLHWTAKAQAVGDASADPWTRRQTIPVGNATDDDRIEGVAFDGENFYVSGANGADSSLIYILNRAGDLTGSFDQPCHTRYGMKDLEWDGGLIWGSGDTIVYGFERDGTLRRSWRGPFNPVNNIAWDSDRGLLWMSGTTTNIIGCNNDGQALDTLSRKGLRIYGLAYYPNDTDGYCLYIVDYPGGNLPACLYKMNTETGDTIRVIDLALPVGATGVGGAFICNNFDRYRGWIIAYVPNLPEISGGDVIHVRQLQPNEEWIRAAPGSGDVAAGDSAVVEVIIRTAARDGSWAFTIGEYEGEVVIEHDGQGERIVLPVHVTVRPPNSAGDVEAPLPSSFGFTSLYPQPFNSTLTLAYRLSEPGVVSLTITDLMGREVLGRTGVPPVSGQFQSAGEHRVSFDATGLPSGVYLARLQAGGSRAAVKVVCLK